MEEGIRKFISVAKGRAVHPGSNAGANEGERRGDREKIYSL